MRPDESPTRRPVEPDLVNTSVGSRAEFGPHACGPASGVHTRGGAPRGRPIVTTPALTAPGRRESTADETWITEHARTTGVGARVTVSVMRDDYVAVLEHALRTAASTAREADRAVTATTGPVSTLVRGDETGVLAYLAALLGTVAASGAHAVAHVHLSRGCPGEVTCGADPTAAAPASLAPLPRVGVEARAHWALYPLLDEVRPATIGDANGAADDAPPPREHLAPVLEAIETARDRGLVGPPQHFVTELIGDLGEVLDLVAGTWLEVGRTVRHVVAHATVSLNHPSEDDVRASRAAAGR